MIISNICFGIYSDIGMAEGGYPWGDKKGTGTCRPQQLQEKKDDILYKEKWRKKEIELNEEILYGTEGKIGNKEQLLVGKIDQLVGAINKLESAISNQNKSTRKWWRRK